MNINKERLQEDLNLAREIAADSFGSEDASVVAAVMNAITSQRFDAALDSTMERLSTDLCRAAAVASGS